MRKLLFVVLVVALASAARGDDPTEICGPAWPPSPESPIACDSYCPGQGGETVCECPSYTDRCGTSTTCGVWNGYWGCWYF